MHPRIHLRVPAVPGYAGGAVAAACVPVVAAAHGSMSNASIALIAALMFATFWGWAPFVALALVFCTGPRSGWSRFGWWIALTVVMCLTHLLAYVTLSGSRHGNADVWSQGAFYVAVALACIAAALLAIALRTRALARR